jgi:hypothetical protein
VKLREGFVIRDVAGQTVVVATGEAAKVFHGMIKLNAVGAFIWKALSKGQTKHSIVSDVVEQFEVDKEQASQDFEIFIEQLRQHGFLIE